MNTAKPIDGQAIADMIKTVSMTKQDREVFAGLKVNFQDIQNDHYDYSKVVVKKPWGSCIKRKNIF